MGAVSLYAFYFITGWNSAAKWQMQAEGTVLVLLASSMEAFSYITSLKIQTMEDMGVDDNIIKMTKNIDDDTFRTWKRAVLSTINLAYSKSVYECKFFNWDEVLKHAEEIRRKHAK